LKQVSINNSIERMKQGRSSDPKSRANLKASLSFAKKKKLRMDNPADLKKALKALANHNNDSDLFSNIKFYQGGITVRV